MFFVVISCSYSTHVSKEDKKSREKKDTQKKKVTRKNNRDV